MAYNQLERLQKENELLKKEKSYLRSEVDRLQDLLDLNLNAFEFITGEIPLIPTLDIIFNSTSKLINFAHGAIFMPNKKDELEIIVSKGYDAETKKLKYKQGLVYYSYLNKEEVYIPNVQKTNWGKLDYEPAFMSIGFHKYIKSVYIVPLGAFQGVFEFLSHQENAFDENTKKSLRTLSQILGLTIQNVKLREVKQKQYSELLDLRTNRTMEISGLLLTLLEERHNYLAGHSARVAYLSGLIAEELGLERQKIELKAKLHDLGKFGIQSEILWSEVRYERKKNPIREHVPIGKGMLEKYHLNDKVLSNIINFHHERWDGSGYPLGLKGDAIPIEARIVAIADVYDALTSFRPYRKGKKFFTSYEALNHIRKGIGNHFGPRVSEAFFKAMKKEFVRNVIYFAEQKIKQHK